MEGFDENIAAAMCSLRAKRAILKRVDSPPFQRLHGLMANNVDALGTSAAETMLPVVPLFHANSWGIAFSAPSMGTKLVMPGAKLDGASVYELLDTEKVTHTAGVPTVWLMLLNHMAAGNLTLPHLKSVVCGGSAMPRSMIKSFVDMGIRVRHAWGMTEMSPIGTVAAQKPPFAELTGEERLDILQTQGYPPFGVEMKITDVPARTAVGRQDFGRLKVAGPAVAKAYFRSTTYPRRRRLLRHRRRRDPSTSTATCGAPTAPRTSSSPAGEWIRRSTWENLAVGHPAARKPP